MRAPDSDGCGGRGRRLPSRLLSNDKTWLTFSVKRSSPNSTNHAISPNFIIIKIKVLWNRYKTRVNSFKYCILFSRESPLNSLECRFPDVSVSPPVGEKLPWSPLCLLTSINPVVVNYGRGLKMEYSGRNADCIFGWTVFSDKLLVPGVLRLQIWQWRDRSVVVTDKRWDIPWSENANSLQSLYPD